MWSGPRNLSTAMMYSFAARGDCAAWDEPFYAAFLAATGLDHPMTAEILAAGEADPARVAARCAGDVPGGKPFFYQKHMTHHMVPGFPLEFMDACTNVFLIRHPARVIASYLAKRENPTLEDLGFTQQAALFDRVADRTGTAPVVVDSADIRANPAAVLQRLCAAIGLPWTSAMLHWPAGPKPYDGAFAPHWYNRL
jgi:Sulfotransferase domain